MAMTLAEAVAAFTTNNVPVAHVRFRDKRKPPFAEAYLNNSNNVHTDDRTWRAFCEYEFVLCTRDRDLALEARIEDALGEADITWEKRGGFRADEDLVTITYRFEVFER